MALQNSKKIMGLDAPVAYSVVEGISWSKRRSGHLVVSINTYASKEARDAGQGPISSERHQLDVQPNSTMSISEAYLLIKQLPEFADAADV